MLAVALGAAVLTQMTLGGLVSSNYAGLVCPDWPACGAGIWFPTFEGLVGLQVFHRLGAYFVLTCAAALALTVREHPSLRGPAFVVFAVVLGQASLGIANVLMAMPVELAILHSAGADLVVASTTVLVFRALSLPREQTVGAWAAGSERA